MDDNTGEDTSNGQQRPVSVLMLVPNMVTLVGLSFGLTAIRFAIEGSFATAVFLILMAVIADGLDGLLARRLGASSLLGAQLDSLSDFLCFGVAPVIVVYLLHLSEAGGFGWVAALLFAVATSLRLARFNVMSGQADPGEVPTRHLVGVPAPGGALLALLPAFLALANVIEPHDAHVIVSIWLCGVSVLMISTLKTISPKALKVPPRLIVVIFLSTIILIGLSFFRPWFLLIALDAVYLMTILYALVQAKGRLFA